MTFERIRRQIPYEEFDYQMLLHCLKDYARPRDKIRALLASGAIIRVKKGLYVFGGEYSREPYSRELLANLIYGPSYVSLEYALSYYGMIPERAETITSVTSGKNRAFSTPVGRFTYWAVPLDYYRTGIDIVTVGEKRSCLIGTREKALADKVYQERGLPITRAGEFDAYLIEHLRMDAESVSGLDVRRMEEIASHSRAQRVGLLAQFLRRKKRRRNLR